MSADLSDWLNHYIKFISFEFWFSHFLAAQCVEMIFCRDVIAASFINNIQFWFEDYQLMLFDQQWDKMEVNVIYEIKNFWENLHVSDLKSETSSELLCKWDFMILRSHDLKISWLTVMWSELWHLQCNIKKYKFYIIEIH